MLERPDTSTFAERLYACTPEEIAQLPTMVIWMFASKTDPADKRFFVKNHLFASNYREKIRGALMHFDFVEEMDTGVPLQLENDGRLNYDSLLRLQQETAKLQATYRKLIGK